MNGRILFLLAFEFPPKYFLLENQEIFYPHGFGVLTFPYHALTSLSCFSPCIDEDLVSLLNLLSKSGGIDEENIQIKKSGVKSVFMK